MHHGDPWKVGLMGMTSVTLPFALTNHVVLRYVERQRKINAIRLPEGYSELSDIILSNLQNAEENRAVWNNTDFMSYIVQTYGSERYSIYLDEDSGMVFVVVNKPHCRLVLTCYHRDSSNIGHLKKKKRRY